MLQGYILKIILTAPPILLALTIHECAHAWVANRLGDPTAKMLGRVTLNPIKHLDPIGTLMLFFSGLFGWAKPVPVNPRNFRNIGRDMMWVSLAGPLSNLALAAVSAEVRNGASGSASRPKNGVPSGSNSKRCVKVALSAVAFQAQS